MKKLLQSFFPKFKLFIHLIVFGAFFSKVTFASTLPRCQAPLNKMIDLEFRKMSFYQRGDNFHDLKERAYYNDGKGRTLGGSILISTGRVLGASSAGAVIGAASGVLAAPVGAGLIIGGGVLALSLGCIAITVVSFGLATGVCIPGLDMEGGGPAETVFPHTVRKLTNAGSTVMKNWKLLSATGAGIGAITGGTVSVFKSTKDSIRSVRIHRAAQLLKLIQGAYSDDPNLWNEALENYGKRFSSRYQSEELKNRIKELDMNKSLCNQGILKSKKLRELLIDLEINDETTEMGQPMEN